MDCDFSVGDIVLVQGVEGEVTDVFSLGGQCYLKVKTRHGEVNVRCDEVEPA